MVLYLDLAFALNALSDLLALYVTARFSGQMVRWRRVIPASLLGGTYGVVCLLPSAYLLRNFAAQIALAIFMVWFVFRTREIFLRLFFLYFLLSCTMGGAFMAFARFASEWGSEELLKNLDWKAFILASIFCWFILSVGFNGASKHIVSGQICVGRILSNGRTVRLDILLDTGHTLTDPFSGAPVLTVWNDALSELWSEEEKDILSRLEYVGCLACITELSKIAPGRFCLLPYRAVGIRKGMLLCFRPDEVWIDGVRSGSVVVALSPTPVSDGGGYVALWGGERRAAV